MTDNYHVRAKSEIKIGVKTGGTLTYIYKAGTKLDHILAHIISLELSNKSKDELRAFIDECIGDDGK